LNVRLSLFGLAVAAFGLLLWARLILVTGHPRIATADQPAHVQPATDSASAPQPRTTSAESASEHQPN
jgi:hypothetical protein